MPEPAKPAKRGRGENSLVKFTIETRPEARKNFIEYLKANGISAKKYGEIALHEKMRTDEIISKEVFDRIDFLARKPRKGSVSYKAKFEETASKLITLQQELEVLKTKK